MIDVASFISTRPSSGITLPCMRDGISMVEECKQGTPTAKTHVNNDFQIYTFDEFKSMNITIIYRHCARSQYCRTVFQIYNVTYDLEIGGIPTAFAAPYLEHLSVGGAPIMHGFSTMLSWKSGSPTGEEGNSSQLCVADRDRMPDTRGLQ